MSRRITKLFNIDIKSVDEENRQITFCFSDDGEDRQGEIVDQASWDTKNYENNPLILWGHDPSEPENVLGQGIALDLNKGGKSYITAQFDDAETNPRADMVFRQLVKRTLRCVSAGFISRKETRQAGVPFLQDNELLEVSIVPIPANPRAIALAYKEGSISKKDLNWLKASMTKELEYLEKQLEQEEEDDSVSKETEKAMLAALESVSKGMTALTDEVKELKEAKVKGLVADVADADHSWELQDDKYDVMQPVAELFYALQEAWFFSTTPIDAFKDLVSEFASLIGAVADGSYDEKSLPSHEALAKAFEIVKEKDLKELVGKAVQKAASEDEEVDEDKDDADKIVDTPDAAEEDVDSDEDQDKDVDKDKNLNVAKSVDEDGDSEAAEEGADEDEAADGDEEVDEDDLDLELDEDAELTDDLKEKIDSELEKTVAEAVA